MRNPVPASQLKLSMAMCGRVPSPPPPPPPAPAKPLPTSGLNITLIFEGAQGWAVRLQGVGYNDEWSQHACGPGELRTECSRLASCISHPWPACLPAH